MGLSDRENKRKKSVVNSLVGGVVENEQPKKPAEQVKFKQKAYYITDDIYKAVNLKAAKTGKDKSEVVRDALSKYLKDILQEIENEKSK